MCIRDSHLEQSVELVGDTPGTLVQIITTNPGSEYVLSFAFASNPERDGIMVGLVEVVGSKGILFEQSFEHSGSDAWEMNYESIRACFVADADSSLIRFSAVNEDNDGGVVIDEVQIVEILLGDVDQDGDISLLDVEPFISAITGADYIAEADTNCDGFVSLLDVQPFVNILTGG